MSEGTAEVPEAGAAREQAATEAASIAAVGAVVASETATEARDTANVAMEEASEAQASVLAVAEEVAETREAAVEAIQSVAEGTVSRQDFETFRAEMAPVLQRFADMEAARIAGEQSQNQVEEVSVEDGTGSGTSGGNDARPGTVPGDNGPDSGKGSQPVSASAAPRRTSGLRHRRKRA